VPRSKPVVARLEPDPGPDPSATPLYRGGVRSLGSLASGTQAVRAALGLCPRLLDLEAGLRNRRASAEDRFRLTTIFGENEQDILWGYGAETAQMRRCCAFRFPTRGDEIFCGNFVGRGTETGVQHSLERCLISGVSARPSDAQGETIDCSVQPAFRSRSLI
jgi:hypothetical protein